MKSFAWGQLTRCPFVYHTCMVDFFVYSLRMHAPHSKIFEKMEGYVDYPPFKMVLSR